MVAFNRPRTAVAEPPRRRAPRPAPASAVLSSTVVTGAAVPALRHFAGETARRWALSEQTADALSLVVSELVTNVVLHSGSPDVTVLLARGDDDIRVEVKDSGSWQTRLTPRLVPEDDDAACGRGLELVKHFSNWWLAFLDPRGTRVVASLPAVAAAA
jgi:anti-sigma regulatory factor (Ser/Thr protein kinase)